MRDAIPLASVTFSSPSLDDVFLQQTGRRIRPEELSRTPSRRPSACGWAEEAINLKYDGLYDVWYLYIRATKLYLRNPILIFFSLFQPIIFLVLFTQLFSNISSFPGFPPGSYLQFAMAGIILQNAFIGALQSGTSIVDDLTSGYLSKMLVTPVNRIAILMGRLLSDATRMIIQSTIIIALAILLGATIVTGVAGFLLILFTVAFFGIAWAGISLAIGLRTKRAETVAAIGAFLTFPLLFMSTALVSTSFLP